MPPLDNPRHERFAQELAKSADRPDYAKQANTLSRLGATAAEIEQFFALLPTEDDWLYACLLVIRQDRRGHIAARKRARSKARKARLLASPARRIQNATAARLWAALKGRSDGKLFSRLGYSAEDLCAHLEARFLPEMGWHNYGKWHVDHIRPCASFDQSNPQEFAACWALSNLQPLWKEDNIRKGARYVATQ